MQRSRSRRTRQLELELRTWGGPRKGAGRKRVAPRPRVAHVRRPELPREHPVLVTVRICDGVPNLRQPAAWAVIVRVFRKALGRFGMHVVEYTVLGNHLHMIVECEGRDSLSRGMRGLTTRLAKQLNKLFERRGKVIDGRYHARELKTPLEVRNALRYVLLNDAEHRARNGLRIDGTRVDPCSSAARFRGWQTQPNTRNRDKDFGTADARTWLLRTG